MSDFAITIPGDRVIHERKNGLWFFKEPTLTSFSLEEVVEGFKADPNILIRTELINEEGEKTLLDRQSSLTKLADATQVVEGANLVHNEYGSRLFADFFFFIN